MKVGIVLFGPPCMSSTAELINWPTSNGLHCRTIGCRIFRCYVSWGCWRSIHLCDYQFITWVIIIILPVWLTDRRNDVSSNLSTDRPRPHHTVPLINAGKLTRSASGNLLLLFFLLSVPCLYNAVLARSYYRTAPTFTLLLTECCIYSH